MTTLPVIPLARVDASTTRWQPLDDHLVKVGRRAAKCFPFPEIADLAGRFHDIGKYAPGWQSDLRAGIHGRDHSTA